MKIFILAMAMAATVFASESILLKVDRHGDYYEHKLKFEFNEELGRAWVNLITVEGMDSEWEDVEEKIKVEGLKYVDGEVVYEKDGVQTVCANTQPYGRWIFRTTIFDNTDNCILEKKTKIVSVDDGFEIKDVKKTYIYLTIL